MSSVGSRAPAREVHCEEALRWLARRGVLEGCSLVTSLPDVSELGGMPLAEWKRWFSNAACAVLAACPDDGVAIFFQSDIKNDGVWIDKGNLVAGAAEQLGFQLLWHKVVCRKPPGTISYGRPTYSHMHCFSRGVRVDPSKAKPTPDVLADAGASLWTRGMGVRACALACRFVLENTNTRTIVDPFCGKGTVLAVANNLGLDAIGVELAKKRAQLARNLSLPLPGRG